MCITVQKKRLHPIKWTLEKIVINARAETLLCLVWKISLEVTSCFLAYNWDVSFYRVPTTDWAHYPTAEAWQRTDKNPRSVLANQGCIRRGLWLIGLTGKPHHSLWGRCMTSKIRSSLYIAGWIRWENEQYKINNSFTPLLLFRVTETIPAHIDQKAGKHHGRLNS